MLDLTTVDIRRAVVDPPPYGNTPLLIHCPVHNDDSASLCVFPDHIRCLGCSFAVQKRLEALAWLLKLPSWRDALRIADQYTFLEETKQQRQKETLTRKPDMIDVRSYEKILHTVCSDRIEWLLNRGLSLQAIQQFRLGHTGASFVIPVFDQDMNVVTMRFRNDEDVSGKYIYEYDQEDNISKTRKKPKYTGWKDHNSTILYPLWRFHTNRCRRLVVVEGEFDAILLWYFGITALTVTNGAGQQSSIINLLRDYFTCNSSNPYRRPEIDHIIICGDQDAPGREASQKTAAEAKKFVNQVDVMKWDIALGKDITELVLNTGEDFNALHELYGFRLDCLR